MKHLAVSIVLGIAATLILGNHARAQCEVQMLGGDDGLGIHMAMNDMFVILGPWVTLADPHYVIAYRREGTVVVEQSVITAQEDYFGSGFGAEVEVSGEWLAVADPHAPLRTSHGKVYTYRRIDGQWVHTQTLEAPGTAGRFGHAIDIDGDRMLIGAPKWADMKSSPPIAWVGRAYLYRWNGVEWAPEAEIHNPFPVGGNDFGWSASAL